MMPEANFGGHVQTTSSLHFLAFMATPITPLSPPTQKQESYPYGFKSRSSDVLTPVTTGSPSTSTTRHDDPSYGSHRLIPLNKSHKNEKSNSYKSSNTWLGLNSRGEQVILPNDPCSWDPQQLTSHLITKSHTGDGTPIKLATIQDVTQFIRECKVSGRVFLLLDKEDFQEIPDLDPFSRNVMWDAAFSLRRRVLPHVPDKSSSVSITAVQRGNVLSIVGVFKRGPSEISDVVEYDPDTQQNNTRGQSRKNASKGASESTDGPNKSQVRDVVGSSDPSRSSPAFGYSAATTSEVSGPGESKQPLASSSKPQTSQSPALIPVFLPPPATPTDVILNEVSDIPHRRRLYQQQSPTQQTSPFPVFQEPEDVADEISFSPYRATRELDIVSFSAPRGVDELSTTEPYSRAYGESPPTASRTISVETKYLGEQALIQDFTSQTPRSLCILQPTRDKNRAPELGHTSFALQDLFIPVQPDVEFDEPFSAGPSTNPEREALHIIEALRARLMELETRLEFMEKADFIRERINRDTELLDDNQLRHWRQSRRRCSNASFNELSDGETDFFVNSPSTGIHVLKNILGSAISVGSARSWQSTLILLAGATTGISIVLLPGLLRHLWSRW